MGEDLFLNREAADFLRQFPAEAAAGRGSFPWGLD